MEEYYFLFALVFLWLLFASIQDIKKREISNWLNFSLIGLGLAYKLVYSLFNGWNMFIYGFLGFICFYILALIVYYTGAFGGGDAKLLMGIGAVLPSSSLLVLSSSSLLFLIVFLFVGAIYSLIYSAFVAVSNSGRFNPLFKMQFLRVWKSYYFIIPLFILIVLLKLDFSFVFLGIILILLPVLYSYTKAVDSCMIKLVSWKDLQEGDWIVNNIRLGNKLVKSRASGLNEDEVKLLNKMKRKVFVKYGVPFAPAFLISFIVTVFVFLRLESVLSFLVSFLF